MQGHIHRPPPHFPPFPLFLPRPHSGPIAEQKRKSKKKTHPPDTIDASVQGGCLRVPSSLSPHPPEYLDFLGSLFTTAIVNWAKWLQPVREKREREKGSQASVSARCVARIERNEDKTKKKIKQISRRVRVKAAIEHRRTHPVATCRSRRRRGKATNGCRRRTLADRRGCTWKKRDSGGSSRRSALLSVGSASPHRRDVFFFFPPL